MTKIFSTLFATIALFSCSPVIEPCPKAVSGDMVYVVVEGWHAEIGIPVEELGEELAFYRKVFPNARVIMFGYGKKTFVTAPAESWSEYVIGPFPGAAVIHTVGLSVTPPVAYPDKSVITLALPAGGSKALSHYIWNDLSKDDAGKPRIVAPSTDPDGLFYAANSEYNLLHTCNGWTADILQTAGLPLSADNVIISTQIMGRANEVAQTQCQALLRN